MIVAKDFSAFSREELLASAAELQPKIAELHASQEVSCAEIDQLKRGGIRQVELFAEDNWVADPKPPERRPDSGPFCYRCVPSTPQAA